tara:strand:- start:1321 stop:1506 length:186 start_codon:yes stop_codon:yes gene_type:complete
MAEPFRRFPSLDKLSTEVYLLAIRDCLRHNRPLVCAARFAKSQAAAKAPDAQPGFAGRDQK